MFFASHERRVRPVKPDGYWLFLGADGSSQQTVVGLCSTHSVVDCHLELKINPISVLVLTCVVKHE
jgi:hypothetical protein